MTLFVSMSLSSFFIFARLSISLSSVILLLIRHKFSRLGSNSDTSSILLTRLFVRISDRNLLYRRRYF